MVSVPKLDYDRYRRGAVVRAQLSAKAALQKSEQCALPL